MEPRPSIPPESVQLCPACEKPVDVLRAGHVAILDGKFSYFCDANCKATYVHMLAKGAVLEGATAEPPRVAPISALTPTTAAAPSSKSGTSFPVPASTREPPSSRNGARSSARLLVSSPNVLDEAPPSSEIELPPPSIDLGTIPSTRRSPPSSHGASEKQGEKLSWLSPLAASLGALSFMIGLAGDGVSQLRLPLAVLALVALGVSESRRSSRDDFHWLARLLPVLLALAAAVFARATSNPHAPRLASLSGLLAAALAVTFAISHRARRDVERARADILARLDVPSNVVVGDGSKSVPAAEVKAGDQVVVSAGELVGVDGVVLGGEAEVACFLDAPATVRKKEGDAIVSGARVLRGAVRLLATFAGNERAYVRSVASKVHRADVSDPHLLSLASGVSRGALGVSVVAFAFPLVLGASIPDAVAVVASALASFSLVGVIAAMKDCVARAQLAALARGIVYKDARSFEVASRVDVAVVCSRGTVLLGEPELVSVESFGVPEERVLSLAAGAETASTHPLALAVLHATKARGVAAHAVRSAVVHPGLGVTALASGGDRIVVGSRVFLLRERVSIAAAESKLGELESQGRSVLLVAVAGKLAGLIALQDGLRPGARAAMRKLHDAHIEPVLLSGEARDTCETIGRALEIDHVRPEVLSQERGTEVRALREGGHVVAVIGHAASDDGALGAADASVSLASLGAVPSEWAVSLASDDVRDAVFALTLARAEKERARKTLWLGLAPPMLVVLGMAVGVLPVETGALAGVLALLSGLRASRASDAY